jgi:hypothetical protein
MISFSLLIGETANTAESDCNVDNQGFCWTHGQKCGFSVNREKKKPISVGKSSIFEYPESSSDASGYVTGQTAQQRLNLGALGDPKPKSSRKKRRRVGYDE